MPSPPSPSARTGNSGWAPRAGASHFANGILEDLHPGDHRRRAAGQLRHLPGHRPGGEVVRHQERLRHAAGLGLDHLHRGQDFRPVAQQDGHRPGGGLLRATSGWAPSPAWCSSPGSSWTPVTRESTHGGLPHNSITYLTVSPQGDLWVGTQMGAGAALGRGVDLLQGGQGPGGAGRGAGLPPRLRKQGAGGSLWMAGKGGAARYDGGQLDPFQQEQYHRHPDALRLPCPAGTERRSLVRHPERRIPDGSGRRGVTARSDREAGSRIRQSTTKKL